MAGGWWESRIYNGDGKPDYLLSNGVQTAIWYLSGATLLSGAFGPTLADGYFLTAAAISTGTASPIMSSKTPARDKQQSGTLTTTYSSAALLARPCRLVGACLLRSPEPRETATATGIIERLHDAHGARPRRWL